MFDSNTKSKEGGSLVMFKGIHGNYFFFALPLKIQGCSCFGIKKGSEIFGIIWLHKNRR